jgi:YidC/Oxa1 family membrane protein insertase
MSVLDPLSSALASVVAAAHSGLSSLGADPASGTTWLLCIAGVVAVVRVALLPLAIHGVRVAHASARARPELQELAGVAAGEPLGALGPGLVASLGAATLLGVPLAERGYFGAGWTHLAVVAGLACAAAAVTYVTQRHFVAPNTVLSDLPEVMARTQQLMPALSALGLVVAGGVVPVALLVYWVCNGAWTMGQAAVVWRWFPTPGSPAAGRRAGR